MAKAASATGLIEARIRPVYRPKPKRIELSGSTKPVPFILRPFSGLYNPYPYGCSVLCNHPADCEAKEVLRRAKDSWATEGKALLLPEEMEMIKANLMTTSGVTGISGNIRIEVINTDEATVPEELFRKYTETDSRPLTPAPTLASGPVLTSRPIDDEFPVTCNPRERTTLVLDLRTNSHKQENDTFTWHALTLESPPTHRKAEIFISKPKLRCQSRSLNPPADVSNLFVTTDASESNSSINVVEGQIEKVSKEQQPTIIRRRGKRLRKGKCRRGSAYGQQTEVRDLFETTETQISHIGDGSRRTSLVTIHSKYFYFLILIQDVFPFFYRIHTANSDAENLSTSPKKASAVTNIPSTMLPSFLEPDILKHLCRELDSDKVEAEFSIRRKLAFKEALRVKGETYSRTRRSQTSNPALSNTPRVFSRQVARFEILDSGSLRGLTVMDYLSKHVFVSSGRKLIFGRFFNKYQDDTTRDVKKILPHNIPEALQEVIGKPMTEEQETHFKFLFGEIEKPLNFRSWCGLCAAVERLFCPLPQKEVDSASWLERVDFETLERRLGSVVNVDPKLAMFLREIREK
nr:PREDICTED: uncharacterized protein LOC100880229 isoform X1 [Megachile rotundata]